MDRRLPAPFPRYWTCITGREVFADAVGLTDLTGMGNNPVSELRPIAAAQEGAKRSRKPPFNR